MLYNIKYALKRIGANHRQTFRYNLSVAKSE
jgi:hypothetical protein